MKIESGLNSLLKQLSQTGPASGGPGQPGISTTKLEDSPVSAVSGKVDIGQIAKSLSQAYAKIEEAGFGNEAQVERLAAAVASSNYSQNAMVTAERMIDFELSLERVL